VRPTRASQWSALCQCRERAEPRAVGSSCLSGWAADTPERKPRLQRQVRTLGWLERLPADVVGARPALSSIQIWAAFVIGKVPEARERLFRATEALRAGNLSAERRESARIQYQVHAALIAGGERLAQRQLDDASSESGSVREQLELAWLRALALEQRGLSDQTGIAQRRSNRTYGQDMPTG